MKDFEKDLIYYPNPDPIEEPRFVLNSVDELEKSTKYSVICNGTERVVYHTDSFDYVVVVDNEAYDLEISIHTPFEELAIRPTSFGIEPSVKGETVHIHLDEPRKFTVETDGGLHDALFVFCSRRIEKPENTTICFEKGKAYNVGVLTLKSNDTVYIEEGAGSAENLRKIQSRHHGMETGNHGSGSDHRSCVWYNQPFGKTGCKYSLVCGTGADKLLGYKNRACAYCG